MGRDRARAARTVRRTAAGRWSVVALLVAGLVATPLAVAAWPVPDSDLSATDLLERVRASADEPYVGLVRSRGGVELPTDDSLEGTAKLLGRDGTVRVWWSGPDAWRTATLRTTGETDLVHQAGMNLRWVYESKNVTLYPDPAVRLPLSSDVLPPVLARRVLEDVRPDELQRLPAERVAGRTALGLRVTPADEQSSVGRVDLWADEESGLPLRVEVYGDAGPAALATAFSEVSLEEPSDEVFVFDPPDDARVRYDDVVDAATAADLYADRVTPDTLAGLPARTDGYGSVGLYGRGPTVLLALPLREGDAEDLADELGTRPGSVCTRQGRAAAAGPLQLLVTDPDRDPWLLAGTVTQDAATTAARELRLGWQVGPPDPLDATTEPGARPTTGSPCT